MPVRRAEPRASSRAEDPAHPSSVPAAARAVGLSRRGTLATVMALATVAFKPRDAAAAEEAAGGDAAISSAASGAPETVYFG